MGAEIERRYGSDAKVIYRNAELDEVKTSFAKLIEEFSNRGLLYPVTVVDGVPVYDGAVSYPAIMRAVGNKLTEREQAAQA